VTHFSDNKNWLNGVLGADSGTDDVELFFLTKWLLESIPLFRQRFFQDQYTGLLFS
jgi:hypothetical protein